MYDPELAKQQDGLPEQSSSNLEHVPRSRESPILLRVNADDQDKKTICIFWVVLFACVLLIAILAAFAIPHTYVKSNRREMVEDTNIPNCENPAGIANDEVTCENFNVNYTLGEVIRGWSAINQFGLLYLQIIPDSLTRQIAFNQKWTLDLYSISPTVNANDSKIHLHINSKLDEVSADIDTTTNNMADLYSDDGRTKIGYTLLMAIIVDLADDELFVTIHFEDGSEFTHVTDQWLQSYSVNPKFTTFTIVIRLMFMAIAILTCSLYMSRFIKIPKNKRIIEQTMVAVASVLLIMFNDPFYAITVLKPNGASAFFSTLFVINLVAFLFLMWLVWADRIFFEDGKIQTEQLTWKKIVYTVILWLQLLISMMVYTMEQINKHPLIPSSFENRFLAAKIIIGITAMLAIIYIIYRYARSCMADEGRMWRSMVFMVFSCVFIMVLFILLVTNSLTLFNYSGSAIMIGYGFINTYVYYLQYMYAITEEESEKIDSGDVEVPHSNVDMVTVGTIDIVDVDLDYDERLGRNDGREELVEMESELDAGFGGDSPPKKKMNDSFEMDYE